MKSASVMDLMTMMGRLLRRRGRQSGQPPSCGRRRSGKKAM